MRYYILKESISEYVSITKYPDISRDISTYIFKSIEFEFIQD